MITKVKENDKWQLQLVTTKKKTFFFCTGFRSNKKVWIFNTIYNKIYEKIINMTAATVTITTTRTNKKEL